MSQITDLAKIGFVANRPPVRVLDEPINYTNLRHLLVCVFVVIPQIGKCKTSDTSCKLRGFKLLEFDIYFVRVYFKIVGVGYLNNYFANQLIFNLGVVEAGKMHSVLSIGLDRVQADGNMCSEMQFCNTI